MDKKAELEAHLSEWSKKREPFLYDGFVTYGVEKQTVLFIGAESNTSTESKYPKCGVCKTPEFFWFSMPACCGTTRYHNRAKDFLDGLEGLPLNTHKDFKHYNHNVAYMNLNKSGGAAGIHNYDCFKNKVLVDARDIEEEIRIIDPAIIVIFGKNAQNAFKALLAALGKSISYLKIAHFCCCSIEEAFHAGCHAPKQPV